jgi:hypothetical protein
MSRKPKWTKLKVGDVVALRSLVPEWHEKCDFGVVTDRDGVGSAMCVQVRWVLIGRTGWYLASKLEKLGEVEDVPRP